MDPGFDQFQRWTWWFASPNHLGAVAAAGLCVVAGVLSAGFRREQPRWSVLMLLVMVALTLVAAVAWSCSRGAWLALAIGLPALAWLLRTRSAWITTAVLFLAIVGAVAAVPRAAARAATIGAVGGDASSQSRLRTWSAAAVMAADAPLTGAGWGTFSPTYTRWYEPAGRDDRLPAANNDTLHLSAELGSPVAWLHLASGATVALSLLAGARASVSGLGPGVGCALIVFLFAGCWSSLISFPVVACHYLALLVAGGVLALRTHSRPVLARATIAGAAVATVGCVATLIAGWLIQRHELTRPGHDGAGVVSAEPRHVPQRGTVVVRAQPGDSDRLVCRGLLRPLAAAGWRAISATPAGTLEQVHAVSGSHPELPLVLLCLEPASTDLAAAWARGEAGIPGLDAAVLCDGDLTPLAQHPERLPCALLRVRGQFTGSRSEEEARLVSAAAAAHPGSALLTVPWSTTWTRLGPRLVEEIRGWIDAIPLRQHAMNGVHPSAKDLLLPANTQDHR